MRGWALVASIVLICAGQSAVAQPQPGLAPAMGVAAAPRLDFSPRDMVLAELAAGVPDLAAYYGSHGLWPIFMGADAARLRSALHEAVSTAPLHGIPPGRYNADVLATDAADVRAEVAQARILVRYLRDMTGGVVRPASVDPLIKREPGRPAIARLIRDFTQASDPRQFLLDLQPRHPAYIALQRALGGDQGLVVPAQSAPRARRAVAPGNARARRDPDPRAAGGHRFWRANGRPAGL